MKLMRSIACLYLVIVAGVHAAVCQPAARLDKSLQQVMDFVMKPRNKTLDDWHALQPALNAVIDVYPILDQSFPGERDVNLQELIDELNGQKYDDKSIRTLLYQAISGYMQYIVDQKLIPVAEYDAYVLFINTFYDKQIELMKMQSAGQQNIASAQENRDVDLAKIKAQRRQHRKPMIVKPKAKL
jgi:hypothetical protein